MGGGKSGGGGSYVAGYRYHMGVQLIACHGPVDSVNRIIIGEREAWTGVVTENATIYLDKPELFGGDSREGGVRGNVDVMMGAANQARNPYLATHQGEQCSAYRGLLSILFKQFLWASGNPYFKSPWVEVTRVLKGWQGNTPWHHELAVVNTQDMNPAHIIYQCFTDNAWGMGYNPADIDEGSFLIAATQLHTEGFGLSLEWDTQSSVEEFVQQVVDHINGVVGLNLATGKFRLRLIRDDYEMSSLLTLDESNIVEMKSFQRAAYGDSANEVVVTYTDRDQNAKPVAVQDLASISAQGGVISVSRSYPGIRTPELAARVALRDLRTLSAPLAKAVIVTNRIMWDREKGDVVKLVWPNRGIEGAAFRVIDIDKGDLVNGKITVTMVEDVFGLPNNSYTTTTPSQWVDSVVAPIAVDASRAVESPYWDVVRNVKLSDQANLEPGYGFGMFMAGRGSVRSTFNYTLSASPDNITYSDVGTGHFNPVGMLANDLSLTAESLNLTGAYDLASVVLSENGGYAYIGDECVSVISVDPSSGVCVVRRGILDTVPAHHTAGTKMFFVTNGTTYDTTERTDGEVVYYKPRPTTGLGTLDPSAAEVETLTLTNRASRPYPPGNFKIGGLSYPTTINGPHIAASWNHRDRIAQTVDFVDYKQGNIGPESGVTYRVRVLNGATLLRTYNLSGDTTSWTYPTDDDIADGRLSTFTIVVTSVRDGIESYQGCSHTASRLVMIGGTYIEGAPATPSLTATPGPFRIELAWLFGDERTNVLKAELWVSDTPIFTDGKPLKYVNYPDTEYVDEIELAGAYRWYWARTYDTAGQMSQWSTVAFARAEYSVMSTSDILDALAGQITETSLISALRDRINLIDGPGSLAGSVNSRLATLQSQVNDLQNIPLYDNAITYSTGDQVSYGGGLYQSKSSTTGNLPSNATYWLYLGDYSSLGETVAAHTTQIATLTAADAGEVTARETLATQMRGGYTGTDASAVSTGLIASEKAARVSGDNSLASSISSLAATVTTNNTTTTAAITSEQTARANGDNAVASSVTTLQASITGGANLLPNSGFDFDLSGWTLGWEQNSGDNDGVLVRDLAAPTYVPTGMHSIGYTRTGIPSGTRDFGTGNIAVEPGARYCLSAYMAAHRCSISAFMYFFAADGNTAVWAIETPATGEWVDGKLGGESLDGWGRKFVFAVVPTTARFVRVFFRQYPDVVSDPYAWAVRPLLERATPSQTQPSPWSPSVEGLRSSVQVQATSIAGLSAQYTIKVDINGRVTGYGLASTVVDGVPVSEFAIVADRFSIAPVATDANAADGSPFYYLTAPTTVNDKVVPAGAYMKSAFITDLVAEKITAGYLSADRIQALTLTGDKFIANTITGNKIAADTISVNNVESDLRSSGYIAGVSGWRILKSGNVEFNNGTFNGIVSAASVQAALGSASYWQYTTAGTFNLTIPTGLDATTLRIRIVGGSGGGGGGGGGAAGRYVWGSEGVSEQLLLGGNGGAGGDGAGGNPTVIDLNYLSYDGTTLSITVGGGGAGGTAGTGGQTSGAPGGNGGTGGAGYPSSVTSIGSAAGGAGGGAGIRGLVGTVTNVRPSPGATGATAGNGSGGANGLGGAGGDAVVDIVFSAFGPGDPGTVGGVGGPGRVEITVFKGDVLVKNTSYQNMIAWLNTKGLGAVPGNAY